MFTGILLSNLLNQSVFVCSITLLAESKTLDRVFSGCYRLLVSPPRIHMLKPQTQYDGIWRGIFGGN